MATGTQADLYARILDYASRANPYPFTLSCARHRCCGPRTAATWSAPTAKSWR